MNSNNDAKVVYSNVKKFLRLKQSEFACKCGCGMSGMDLDLAFSVEILRHELEFLLGSDLIVDVESGNRCPDHNENTRGAAAGSYHTKSMAGDFTFRYKYTGHLVDHSLVYDVACRLFPDSHGIGKYHNRIHLDSRSYKSRWGN